MMWQACHGRLGRLHLCARVRTRPSLAHWRRDRRQRVPRRIPRDSIAPIIDTLNPLSILGGENNVPERQKYRVPLRRGI